MSSGPLQSSFARLRPLARIAAVFAVAFLLSSALIDGVEAKRIPTDAPIANRVQNQKDLCGIEGGDFSSKDTAFGSTITKCKGGNKGDWTCVNTAQSTDCHKGLVRPDEKPDTQPNGGVYDQPGNAPNHHADGGIGGVAKASQRR